MLVSKNRGGVERAATANSGCPRVLRGPARVVADAIGGRSYIKDHGEVVGPFLDLRIVVEGLFGGSIDIPGLRALSFAPKMFLF